MRIVSKSEAYIWHEFNNNWEELAFESKKILAGYSAKAGHIDHIWPVRLQMVYIAKKQIFNSGLGWSIFPGQLWSRPLTFPDNGESYDFEVNKANYRKFKKKLERVVDDKIRFEFKVTNVIDPNHTQGEIINL